MMLKGISYIALTLYLNFEQRWRGKVYFIVFTVVFLSYPEESIQHSEHGESLKSRIFHSYFLYFWLLDDSFSQKPKHVVSNGPDINVVVSNGSYCVFVHRVLCHNGMSSIQTLSCAKIVYGRWQISEMCVWGVGGTLFIGEMRSTRNETSP